MRGVALLFLLLLVSGIAVVNGSELFFRLAYVLAAVLVVSYLWSWANLIGVEVIPTRETEQAQVGQQVKGMITVINHSRLPKLWLEIRENTDMPDYYASAVVSLPPKGTHCWSVKIPCQRRGQFTMGPVTVISGDPFGLFSCQRTLGETHTLVVHPATVNLSSLLQPSVGLHAAGRPQQRVHYITPNVSGVRDYFFEDSLNRIHWPTTARLGRLMAKEFDMDPGSDIWILLDMDEAVQAGTGDESTEEYGVLIAASLAKASLEAQRPVGLVVSGVPYYQFSPNRGRGQLLEVMDALAVVRAQGQMPLSYVLTSERNDVGRNCTLVVITSSVAESWVSNLRVLARGGVRPVVIWLDPSSFVGSRESLPVIDNLASGDIPVHSVLQGQVIAQVLNWPRLRRT
ncbi:MAG: DUF58 domain-containing protein [Chloroflexi bacterium]|nr:DUF58 domain-containing protein [Chloroflexota bacterium]